MLSEDDPNHGKRGRTAAVFLLILGIGVLWGWGARECGAATLASDPRPVFEYIFEAGAATSTVRCVPRLQAYQTVVMNGVPCLTMTTAGVDKVWYFVVEGKRWNGRAVDGTLTVEYAPSKNGFGGLAYDSGFHEFHRLTGTVFGHPEHGDPSFGASYVSTVEKANGLIQRTFPLTKACFTKLLGNTDFGLVPEDENPLGLHRIVIRVSPAYESERPASSIGVDELLDRIFARFLRRRPKPFERRRYREALWKREISLRTLLSNIIKSREYRVRNVLPLDTFHAIQRLFRISCRRNALPEEIANFISFGRLGTMDFPAPAFVWRHYGEIMESILAEGGGPGL